MFLSLASCTTLRVWWAGVASEGFGDVMQPASEAGSARFERKDVWDMRWSDDDPDLFVLMEKTRMHIFRGLVSEAPVRSLESDPQSSSCSSGFATAVCTHIFSVLRIGDLVWVHLLIL